jgi:hypothetical protein
MYSFSYPSTQKIEFDKYFIQTPTITERHIMLFTGNRERLRTTIEKNILDDTLPAIANYLPYALSLEFFNGAIIPINNMPVFNWKGTLGLKDKRGESMKMKYVDSRCEIAFVLFVSYIPFFS